MRKSEYINLFFWGTIAIGVALPIGVMVVVEFILNRGDFLFAFRSTTLFFFSDFTSLGFLYWVFHSIPFIFLAFLIRSQLGEKADTSKPYILRLSKMIGSWVVMVGFSLFMNIGVLISDSSTAALAYLFIPYYEIIAILVGYGCGWLIGKVILWYKV